MLSVLVVALTAVDYFASKLAANNYIQTLSSELTDKGRMLALLGPPHLGAMNQAQLRAFAQAAGGRLTLVDRSGRVLADSEADATNMDNHASRPEIAAALAGRVGSDRRQSNTIGVTFLYVAVPTEGGAIRLAVPLQEIDGHVNQLRRQLLASVALAFLPAILLAAYFARSVSAKLAAIIGYAGRLARGDFHARLKSGGRDELDILTAQLNETGEKLQKMFEQLQAEHDALERMERIRKDFVINVSHELRTPLASIQGYTETLLDGALHDEENNLRFLNIIRQNAERLGRLIADLMTLSRIELKITKFQFATYYINTLLADCVESMLPIAEKKRVELSVKPAHEKAEVFCDSEAVHQVITNLVDNALKYTSEGGKVVVGSQPASGNPDMMELYVEDTGIGIPPEELPRLFERFYRVDKARSRELGGTGLGLAIVKHLVRAHGGEVWVESRVNQGSKFLFTLPVHDHGLPDEAEVQTELTV